MLGRARGVSSSGRGSWAHSASKKPRSIRGDSSTTLACGTERARTETARTARAAPSDLHARHRSLTASWPRRTDSPPIVERTLFPPIALLCSVPAPLSGPDDWTCWRGPRGDGTAEGSPPIEWSEKRNVRWKADLPGVGLSSPIVAGERVFVTTAVPTGKKKAGVVSE